MNQTEVSIRAASEADLPADLTIPLLPVPGAALRVVAGP